MDRLTYRSKSGRVYAKGKNSITETYERNCGKLTVTTYDALDRLAEYEDTGLTPAQIASLQAEVASLTAQLAEARKREKAAVEDMQYYLENNEENGVVFIPKFAVKKITNWRGPQKGEGK